MGVRLVRYTRDNITGNNNNSGSEIQQDHNELINRDLMDQHPIHAITGLQDFINYYNESVEEILNYELIKGTENTKSFELVYNKETKTMTGNVKISSANGNSIEIRNDGIFCVGGSEIQDTKSIDLIYTNNSDGIRILSGNVNISSKNGNNIKINDDGLYCVGGSEIKNTNSIELKYTTSGDIKTLAANVKISLEDKNKIEIRDDGLYCIGGGNANSNVLEIIQNNHRLSIGNVVYLKADGTYAKAYAEDSERIEVVGIITEVIDSNTFILTVSGEFQTNLYDTYKNGSLLYLSEKTAGTIVNNPTKYIKPIGVKINTGILINIQRANIYEQDDFNETDDYYSNEEIEILIDSIW